MAGIRSFNVNVPGVFRYPEWVSGVFYPSGSVVALEIVDSDVYYDFYAAIRDIQNLTVPPNSNQGEWRLLHDAFQVDSEIIARLLSFDSDMIRLQEAVDSEEHDRKAADSDVRIVLDELWERDSERYLQYRAMFDSDIHDRKSADSDIRHRLAEIDSDISLLFNRSDSDLWLRVFRELDSEIRVRISADSDFKVLVTEVIHDYLAGDSERDSDIVYLRRVIDSDYEAAVRVWSLTGNQFDWGPQPWATSTNLYINQGTLTNHTQGYLWITDQDDQFGARTDVPRTYIIKDGVVLGSRQGVDLWTEEIDLGPLGVFYRGDYVPDGDLSVFRDITDPLPEVTNGIAYQVKEMTRSKSVHQTANNLYDAVRRTVHTVVDVDSDLLALTENLDELKGGYDSDVLQFRHDLLKLDSEVLILMSDRDSDNAIVQALQTNIDSERHDWKAADSDLFVRLSKQFDSDIQLSLAHDSELNVQMDSEENARRNADSDLYNGYTGGGFRYVVSEYEAPQIAGPVLIDYDNAQNFVSIANATNVWIWNNSNDVLTIIDSDGNAVYNAVHLAEPIEISVGQNRYRRGFDTFQNAQIQVNGAAVGIDDIWSYHRDEISKTKIFGSKVEFLIDSDINLDQKDSDELKIYEWLADKIASGDSDFDKEIHDRKGGDSDLYNGYTGGTFRYVATEYESPQITGLVTIDYDFANNFVSIANATNVWIWNIFTSVLSIIDSDGNPVYNEVHAVEPTEVIVGQVRYRRGTDTTQDAQIQRVGVTVGVDDIWSYHRDEFSKTKIHGSVLEFFADSDINLDQKDSDDYEFHKWLADKLAADDGALDKEIHDRAAADSDLYWTFYVPEETITLNVGQTDYTLTEPLLNERDVWSFSSEINANSRIYTGIENDNFEISHDGTAWTVSVDGVDDVETTTLSITFGAVITTGQPIEVPFTSGASVVIRPSFGDIRSFVVQQISDELTKLNVKHTYVPLTESLTLVTEFSDPKLTSFTDNGLRFDYTTNTVTDNGWYYHAGDTITIKLK